MSVWLYINILVFILVVATLRVSFAAIPAHIYFGLAGLFLILFNWTRHAFFSTIRNTESRQKKIKLATISKRIYPFHKWVGSSALVLISFHAGFILYNYGFAWPAGKIGSGIIAGAVLIGMVTSGWLRLYFPSGRKRRVHIYFGFLLFFSVVIHTLVF